MIPCFLPNVRDELLDALGIAGVAWENVRVIVLVGDNASGKSFFRRLFAAHLHENNKYEIMKISQEGRSTEGIQRAFLYGSENDEATSVISAKTIIKGLQTTRKREEEHYLIYDEPEIGMSEECQLGSALYMRDQLQDWPALLKGLLVTTHSKAIARELLTLPHSKFIWLGQPDKTVADWLQRDIEPTFPEELVERGRNNLRKFVSILQKHGSRK